APGGRWGGRFAGSGAPRGPPVPPMTGIQDAGLARLLLALRQDALELLGLFRVVLQGFLCLLDLGRRGLDLRRELPFALGGLPGLVQLGLGRGHVLRGLRRLRSPGHVADAQPDDGGDDPDHDGLHGTSPSCPEPSGLTSCPWTPAPASARAAPSPWPGRRSPASAGPPSARACRTAP